MGLPNLPLQEMIAGVVQSATQKIAAQSDDWGIRSAEEDDEREEQGEEKRDEKPSLTDPDFVEKLASVCDFLSQNLHNVEPPNRGVLGQAMAKLSESGLPADHGVSMPPATPKGALEATAAPPGEQKYKKDSPATEDPSASQAGTPEGTAGLPAGATQMKNDMESAPGQESGSVPKATYPKDGPLHAGPTKTASPGQELLRRMGKVKQGSKMEAIKDVAKKGLEHFKAHPGQAAAAAGGAGLLTGVGVGRATKDAACKTAGEIARERILAKLAGEDVMKANISASRSASPLVGGGEMDAYEAEQVPSNPTDGSGYGNQQRTHVQSNQAAIDTTKADAKKPRVKELAEVLTEPAFSPAHDSKLREQLRNAGSAGVKIAGAKVREILKLAAAKGALTQEMVDQFQKNAQGMGGAPPPPSPSAGPGMGAFAAGDSPEGCSCNGAKTCKVCKLESLKQKTSTGDEDPLEAALSSGAES